MSDSMTAWTFLAQAADAARPAADAAAKAEPSGLSGTTAFFLVAAAIVLPFLLGNLLAALLRLKDMGFRMGVVLLSVVLGVAPFAYHIVQGDPELSPFNRAKGAIRLGIDLAGGTNLVYQVDVETAKKDKQDLNLSAAMDQMVGAIGRRINPSGTEEVTVRKVGADRIEIIIPGADQQVVEQKKRLITRLGSLEFEILCNRRDDKEAVPRGEQLPESQSEVILGSRIIAIWRDVTPGEDVSDPRGESEIVFRTITRDGKEVLQVLTRVTPDARRVTGKYLTRAYQTNDNNGRLAVGFTFNIKGASRFQALTSENRPLQDGFKRKLAILLDGKVFSAPYINDIISAQGIISGDFKLSDVNELINVLNAGALEVPIRQHPISEFTITPTLGADVQQKGMMAIGIAAVVVFLFMLGYYLVAGAIADFCLLLNIVLVLGIMALIKATFTLPGLAGLVLTIGMAVDANVLIFERIREESHRGSSLRMAIQNGFGRAFTTIVDANVTTLIVAVVLYMIGTDQVRGFAVTLFIGIITSMFTALYFGRLVFDVLERKRMIRSLNMFSLVGATRIDFLGKKMLAAAGSFALILAGVGSLSARGQDNLDIDFRGGTMVTFEFMQPQQVDDIRTFLQKELGTSITLERLTRTGEEETSGAGRRFRLRTTEQDIDNVRKQLVTAFDDAEHEVRKVTLKPDWAIEAIPAAADAAEKAEGAAENEETRPAEAAPAAASGFAGGHSVRLAFNVDDADPQTPDGVTVSTVAGYFEGAVAKLFPKKYEELEALYRLTGTAGPGTTVQEGQVRLYTEVLLETRAGLPLADLEAAIKQMQTTMDETPLFEEVNSFDSAIASDMQQSAILAMVISLVAIVAYIWFRFQRITFGLAAVAALIHDVLAVMGIVAIASLAAGTPFGNALDLYDFKINLPMIAAFLTIVGYSLNDTIVVFDRIREIRGKNPALTVDMVNTSLNQTLSRTLLTSFTTWIVVAILYAIGGEGIHGFAFCLVMGIIVGTYSSIYVASPVLLWLMNRPGSEVGKATAAAEARMTAAR